MDAGTIAAAGTALVSVVAVITAIVNGVATLGNRRRRPEPEKPQPPDDSPTLAA